MSTASYRIYVRARRMRTRRGAFVHAAVSPAVRFRPSCSSKKSWRLRLYACILVINVLRAMVCIHLPNSRLNHQGNQVNILGLEIYRVQANQPTFSWRTTVFSSGNRLIRCPCVICRSPRKLLISCTPSSSSRDASYRQQTGLLCPAT